MSTVLAMPVRPTRFAAGPDLPAGTYHVEAVVGGYNTVVRTIGSTRWYPLTAGENPAWRLWSSFEDALRWIENQDNYPSDYPFWGR
jgi:hypothetical protein